MINAGDELGRSQGGNNNPYNQDNATTWFDWDLEPWQEDLLATTRHLVGIRREHPALRQRTWAEGREVHEDGSIDLAWYGADGQPMQDWSSPDNRTLQMLVNGAWLGHESVLVVLHGGLHEQQLRLPAAPGLSAFTLLWDSVWERPERGGTVRAGEEVTLAPLSLRTYAVTDPT
jgi:glycogen operon protein